MYFMKDMVTWLDKYYSHLFLIKKGYNKIIARIIRKLIILKILSTCKKKESLNAIFANSKVQVNCQHRLACLRHVLMYNVYNTWNYKEVI